jgi:predicted GH43/DUF377 family glycosyl hydrolase
LQAGPVPNRLRISDIRLHPDPARVVLRPFHLGWQASNAPQDRAIRLVANVLALPGDRAKAEYERVLADFSARHWHIENVLDERYAQLETSLGLPAIAEGYRQRLIAAYFCHEYTYAAAALMNPSIVPHPDQSGLEEGAVRFVLSLRAVGEGHISTIAFREGIARPDGSFALWPQGDIATAMRQITGEGNPPPPDTPGARAWISRDMDSTLTNSVIFPVTEQQRNGLEDLRMVRFEDDDGKAEWIGTYTAYSGQSIRSELLRTSDFKTFSLEPVEGRAGRNKGMALFPRRIDGQYMMIGRQDGKNLYLLRSPQLDQWDDDGVLLMEPRFAWEFIQIGNCGSPVLTKAGWLVLTHGVGPMRKYALGAVLLDSADPSKVLARTPEPVLTAENSDRAGYVPNVVYTCGMMPVGDHLLIPYGISDSVVGFATIAIDDILATMA